MSAARCEVFDDLDRLRAQLLPLDRVPDGAPWNEDELREFIEPGRVLAPAAVLVGLVPRPGGTTILLTRRTETLNQHAGQVSFPGGRVDPGDASPIAAALRETWEEVAVRADQIEPVGYLDPYHTITGFRVLPVVARLALDYVAVPNPDEVADAFEVPLAPLLAGRMERASLMFRGQRREYWEYRQGPHRIWGATAAMLVNLGRRLGADI